MHTNNTNTNTTIKDRIKAFLIHAPSQDAIEIFYINQVLPHDKRSIKEILEEEQ